jgi:hypothetical protein
MKHKKISPGICRKMYIKNGAQETSVLQAIWCQNYQDNLDPVSIGFMRIRRFKYVIHMQTFRDGAQGIIFTIFRGRPPWIRTK